MNQNALMVQTPYGPRQITDPYRTLSCTKRNKKAPLRCSRSRESKSRSPSKFPSSYEAAKKLNYEINSYQKQKLLNRDSKNGSVERVEPFIMNTESPEKDERRFESPQMMESPIKSSLRKETVKNYYSRRDKSRPEKTVSFSDNYLSNTTNLLSSKYASNPYQTGVSDSIRIEQNESQLRPNVLAQNAKNYYSKSNFTTDNRSALPAPKNESNDATISNGHFNLLRINDDMDRDLDPFVDRYARASKNRHLRQTRQIDSRIQSQDRSQSNKRSQSAALRYKSQDKYVAKRKIKTRSRKANPPKVLGDSSNVQMFNTVDRRVDEKSNSNNLHNQDNKIHKIETDGKVESSKKLTKENKSENPLTKEHENMLYPALKIFMTQIQMARDLEYLKIKLAHTKDFNLIELFK